MRAGTESVVGRGGSSQVEQGSLLDKVQGMAPVSWVAIDAISMLRNSIAEMDAPGMVAPQVTDVQAVFSGCAVAAGICITTAGVLFLLRGIRALMAAKTAEKRAYAVLDIIYGTIMIFAGLAYAISWAGLTLPVDPAVLQFSSKWGVPIGIFAAYGAGLAISGIKAGRHGFSIPKDVEEKSDEAFKQWLLEKDDEWLQIHTTLTEEKIKNWDHKKWNLKETVRTKNADLFKADCLNVLANIVGGLAFAIALYPGAFFGGLDALTAQRVSAGLFVAAGVLFLPGDTNLIMGFTKKLDEWKEKHRSATYECVQKIHKDLEKWDNTNNAL